MANEMITQIEAQDHINAIILQRDAAQNQNVQLHAALAKSQRELAAAGQALGEVQQNLTAKGARIDELEAQIAAKAVQEVPDQSAGTPPQE
jgi:septal ring factor EnvC (AmiA/AmiB activator)